jgi:hypothetical protein
MAGPRVFNVNSILLANSKLRHTGRKGRRRKAREG